MKKKTFKVIKTQTRLSTKIPFSFQFYPQTEKQKLYVEENYIKNKKLLTVKSEMSKDGLVSIIIVTWKSIEDFLDFAVDDWFAATDGNDKIRYDLKNNIKTVAENISTPEIASVIKSLDVDLLQGYHYGKAQRAEYYSLTT